MRDWKFYIETYGCKVNQYESEALREAWQKNGGLECAAPDQADYIVINSCAITGKAERDARNAVFRLKRLAPNARIILCGCAAQFFESFRPRKNANFSQPDICLPQSHKSLLLNGPDSLDLAAGAEVSLPHFAIGAFKRARPVVKIQDGCSQKCTYCIVPQTRGAPKSEAPQKILAETAGLLKAGYCEVTISGVNLRQYGKDRPEYGDFWAVLAYLDKELAPEYAGRARLRISSLEPGQLTARGIDTLLSCKLVCPHIHLSLQHASPGILKRMGRGHYRPETVVDAIGQIERQWRVMGLGADIITGFPGETEEDIEELLGFIEKTPFTYAHVFPYSRRQGTQAGGLPEQLPLRVKRERAERVRLRVAARKRLFQQSLLGLQRFSIACDAAPKSGGKGRGVNEFYAVCHFAVPPGLGRLQGLLPARPVGEDENGIFAELEI